MTDPVLIIGSSRSGTTLLTRILAGNGIFMGADVESNHESKSLQAVNRWILLNAGASLETADRIDALLADDFLRRASIDAIVTHTDRVFGKRFWGKGRQPKHWGFKDPRTTFTLPLWLEVFPDSKVIHMVRHGIDVALSLRARRQRAEQMWHRARVTSLMEQNRAAGNIGVSTIAEGLQHWQRYYTRGRAHAQRLGARAYTIRYEDLIARPTTELEKLSRFLGRELMESSVMLELSTRRHTVERSQLEPDHVETLRMAGYQ